MKKRVYLILSLFLFHWSASSCLAESIPIHLRGSDTMLDMMMEVIERSGLSNDISYLGGGSSLGEQFLIRGDQGIAPMSRLMKREVLDLARELNLNIIQHAFAIDGLGIYVQIENDISGLDLATLREIYSCQITHWEQISNTNLRGPIKAYRRDDLSGTTDTFKTLIHLKEFGSCVMVLDNNQEMAEVTARDPLAVGFAGSSGKREANRLVPLTTSKDSPFVEMTEENLRNGTYALSRKLYFYEVAGSRRPSEVELTLLNDYLLNKDFMIPVLRKHDFFPL